MKSRFGVNGIQYSSSEIRFVAAWSVDREFGVAHRGLLMLRCGNRRRNGRSACEFGILHPTPGAARRGRAELPPLVAEARAALDVVQDDDEADRGDDEEERPEQPERERNGEEERAHPDRIEVAGPDEAVRDVPRAEAGLRRPRRGR